MLNQFYFILLKQWIMFYKNEALIGQAKCHEEWQIKVTLNFKFWQLHNLIFINHN